jgi:hypothetical protein
MLGLCNFLPMVRKYTGSKEAMIPLYYTTHALVDYKVHGFICLVLQQRTIEFLEENRVLGLLLFAISAVSSGP